MLNINMIWRYKYLIHISDFLGVGFAEVTQLCSVTMYCDISPQNTLNMKSFRYGQVCGCLFFYEFDRVCPLVA